MSDGAHSSRPPVWRRLLGFAVVVLGPLLVGALISGGVLLDAARRSTNLAAETVEETRVSMVMLESMQAARLAGSAAMEEGDRQSLQRFRRLERRIDAQLSSPVFDTGEREQLDGIRRQWDFARETLAQAPLGGVDGADGEEDLEDVFEDAVNGAIGDVQRLVRSSQRDADASLADVRGALRWQVFVAFVALLGSLVVAVLLARRTARTLVRPLRDLTRAARALERGELEHRVPALRSAEVHELGETFNRMAAALRKQHDQLEQQAFTDSLTGIANRALFEQRAKEAVGRDVAALMIDLDDFKLINDGLGHASGDQLIAAAAERLAAAARPGDMVARLGGDEFAVLVENVHNLDDALGVADRLRRCFHTPFEIGDSALVVSASIGVALANDASDAVDLLRRADLAMYRVKEGGKDGTAYFDPLMENAAITRLDAVGALRNALERGELVAHFQPIVDLDSGAVLSAEALLRWERPGHGLVPPADFIPLAEETGLIQPLGAWILREACTRARAWRDAGHGSRVNVNVSARQLNDPAFERLVADTLAETGLEPNALVLEVTESSVMQNPELTIPKLERLVGTGVRLVLDDFGEGYSSLSHIRRLPIHGLKIARPFVRELGDPAGDPRLVRGIIELARRLELDLVAEGIELRAQREALQAFGCRLGQGFLFARPQPIEPFLDVLAESATPAHPAARGRG